MTLRLLIVDDDEIDRQAIRRALERGGLDATVVECDSTVGLGERVRAERPDCILLDHVVPPETALEVVPRLRAEGITAPILCIGDHDDEVGAELVSAGATDVLAKADLAPGRLARRIRYAIRLVDAELERNRSSRALEKLLAIVSHDLRGPLSAISVAIDALGDLDVPPADRQRYVDAVRRSITRADRLIRDLLDTSLIEAGKLRIEPSPGAVGPLLEQCARDHELLASPHKIRITVEAGDVGRATFDRERVLQALGNLVGNALRHARGTAEIRLRARTVDDDSVELLVEDDGPGIDAEAVPHIFDRFWRGAGSRRSGSGLGLAIVKGIAEAHGGSVAVQSDRAARPGATFSLRLPRQPAATAAAR